MVPHSRVWSWYNSVSLQNKSVRITEVFAAMFQQIWPLSIYQISMMAGAITISHGSLISEFQSIEDKTSYSTSV